MARRRYFQSCFSDFWRFRCEKAPRFHFAEPVAWRGLLLLSWQTTSEKHEQFWEDSHYSKKYSRFSPAKTRYSAWPYRVPPSTRPPSCSWHDSSPVVSLSPPLAPWSVAAAGRWIITHAGASPEVGEPTIVKSSNYQYYIRIQIDPTSYFPSCPFLPYCHYFFYLKPRIVIGPLFYAYIINIDKLKLTELLMSDENPLNSQDSFRDMTLSPQPNRDSNFCFSPYHIA